MDFMNHDIRTQIKTMKLFTDVCFILVEWFKKILKNEKDLKNRVKKNN